MNSRVLLTALTAYVLAGYAASSPAKLYSDLERHLQSLKTLEVRYEASGSTMPDGSLAGRMVWVKPDKFLHDTPEWTLGESGESQWRFLRAQNTLILETSDEGDRWTPEGVLFDLGKSFRPESVEELSGGSLSLKLASQDPNFAGNVLLTFPPGARVPSRLEFRLADGSVTSYQITEWVENQEYEEELFAAPDVPKENVIDFRVPGDASR